MAATPDREGEVPITFPNVKELPGELREEIYASLLPQIDTIVVPEGTLLDYLRSQLPASLKADPHIAEEATMSLLREAMRTTEVIKVPDPDNLVLSTADSKIWANVRTLEFTSTQHRYAASSDTDQAREKITVHSIVMNCPNLKELTFRMETSMMAMPSKDSAKMQIPHTSTRLLRVLEHPKIQKLVLHCANAKQPRIIQYYEGEYQRDIPYKEFVPFADSFRKAAEQRGHGIELLVDLTPGVVKDPRDFEMRRPIEEGFTWIEILDAFGM